MPTNKNATIRYQALDKCFRDYYHRYYIDDLIDRCTDALVNFNGVGNISRRQIFDDINFMESDAGWSIPLERKKDGKRVYYRYDDPDFSINEQPLTEEEAKQLRTVILTLSRFRGLPSNEWVEELVSSLKWRFNLKGKDDNIIGFEQNLYLKGLHLLYPIIEATANRQVLRITYHSYKDPDHQKVFVVHPYYIKKYNNRWFLFALNDEKHYISNFPLDRIVSLEETDEISFSPNQDIDFEHYFDDIVGVTIPRDEVTTQVISLQFTAKQYPYVISKPLHASQQIVDEDNRIITIAVRPNYELDQVILSLGPDVEVLSPQDYRVHIIQKLKENLKKYLSISE